MADHPTAAALRAAWETSDQEDMDAFEATLADDVVWHMIGGDTLNGAAAVVESMSGLANVDFNIDLHDIVSNGEHTVALMSVDVKVADQEFGYRTAEIYHTNDDGKITERWAFSDDTGAINEFFGQFG